MGIADWFRPGWKHSNWEVRKVAVARIKDQAVLAEVVTNEDHPAVRKAAVEHVTDQAVLSKVALNDGSDEVRRAAVERVTDQAVLAQIAAEEVKRYSHDGKDRNWEVRKAAVARVTDQAVLSKVALNDSDEEVCKAAATRVTDQAVLSELAKIAENRAAMKRFGLESDLKRGLMDLRSEDKSRRRKAAENVVRVFKAEPTLMSRAKWTEIARSIGQPHTDIHHSVAHDCTPGNHTDNMGVGLSFPPFPPNLT